ncbi:aldose epimerase family protein [Aurantimonas sp. VKM B-3413]|uniref:aldose epimerase family protein n=1 Tax=Aurantimonas sp. VKM B-3413 TaxID=2779401 RepID=UPI001E5B3F3E|nr:aldose epimerase family protein [Aurantimonas sp. VKM B-3413]MCB8838674.1 galactose mutarotase [Aurantimonas sp. VKM B-3413]
MSETILIASSGLTAEILPMGASIRALRPAGLDHSVVLGLANADLYGARNKDYFGATVGRFANRIAAGRMTIDGEDLTLAVNDPPNHLHGGPTGFSTRLFTVEQRSEDSVTLAYVSEDGEEGYPGRVSVRATFAVSADTLTIGYEAETDRETVVNLSSHLYFNLDGSGPITDHVLGVAADHYLPIDEGTLPDGRIVSVEGTGFDYRSGRSLGDRPRPLDHNFCLAEARSEAPRPAARLSSEKSGIAMELSTTEPGLQVYDGAKLDGTFRGLDGQPIETLGGLALEPQVWPDAPNRPAFPQAVLRPGARYRHLSRYRFTRL